MKLDEILDKLFKNPKILLILLGVIIIAIAGSHTIPILNLRIDDTAGIIFKIIGVVLVLVALFLLIKEDLKSENPSSENTHKNIDFGIKITSIDSKLNTLRTEFIVKVKGEYKQLPPKEELWLFHFDPGTATKKGGYYPQRNPAVIDTQNKVWQGVTKIGGFTPGNYPSRADILIARVRTSGKILCEYYWKVVDETGKYIPFEELPESIIPCDSKDGLKSSNTQ